MNETSLDETASGAEQESDQKETKEETLAGPLGNEQEVTEGTEGEVGGAALSQGERRDGEETKETKEEVGAEQTALTPRPTTSSRVPRSQGEREKVGVERRAHPAGEVFFRGTVEEVTDEEAEEMARGQLERSGLLRGQRVRVGD